MKDTGEQTYVFTAPDLNPNTAPPAPADFDTSAHIDDVVCLALVTTDDADCGDVLANLQNLWVKYGEGAHGVQMVAVQVGSGTDMIEANIVNWLDGIMTAPDEITFPVVNDIGDNDIWNYYSEGTPGVPKLFVIRRGIGISQQISSAHIGVQTEAFIEQRIIEAIRHRDPVDIELVTDVSYSMHSPPPGPYTDSKIDIMKQALIQITQYMGDQGHELDRCGLVSFESEAAVEHALYNIYGNAAPLNGPGGTIDDLTETGATAMGAGLLTAFSELGAPGGGPEKFAILLTDGQQNRNPMVVPVGGHHEIITHPSATHGDSATPDGAHDLEDYDTTIYTIGIGITGTYGDLLDDIATATGGDYLGTNDPGSDVNLLYWLDMCKTFAGGSPTVIHHNAGTYYKEKCREVERFNVSCSISKFTALVSWEKGLQGSLTFWLRAPDGTLLDLHQEMELYDTYASATVYLPNNQDGVELESIGEWEIIIGGVMEEESALYQAMVVGEDPNITFSVDYPRNRYNVGDILPIKLGLKGPEKEVKKAYPKEITVEWSALRIPVTDLLAKYQVSEYELDKKFGDFDKLSPLEKKLEAMQLDPAMQSHLIPQKKILSLSGGTLDCNITDTGFTLPIELLKPGLNNYRVTAHFETKECGPITRVGMVSVNVGLGKPHLDFSVVKPMLVAKRDYHAALLHVDLRNASNKLIGAGLGEHFGVKSGRSDLECEVIDGLDGTYRIEVPLGKKTPAKGKAKPQPIALTFKGETLWKGSVE